MPFSPSGIFERLYSWISDRNAGIKIRADRMDGEFDNIKDAINLITANEIPQRRPIRGYSGSLTAPGYAFDGDGDTGLYRPAPDNLNVAVGGKDTITIDQSGKVAGKHDLDIEGKLALTTDLAIEHGGTGASDAATALTNLGAASKTYADTKANISTPTFNNYVQVIGDYARLELRATKPDGTGLAYIEFTSGNRGVDYDWRVQTSSDGGQFQTHYQGSLGSGTGHKHSVDANGNIWSSGYGWLHDKFLSANTMADKTFQSSTVNAYNIHLRKAANGHFGKLALFETLGNGTQEGPQITFHKQHSSIWSMGIKRYSFEGTNFTFEVNGSGYSWGNQVLMLTPDGTMWSKSYGWLHSKFADRGAECQWNSGVVEFGWVSLGYDPKTVDCPAPYVMAGLRAIADAPWALIRGVKLRNN